MFSFYLIYFVIFIINLHEGRSEISDQRLCADENCSEPVSLATTLLRYHSPDPKILSFLPNSLVKVYSKEAGSILDLWGVEINGRRGYAPKKMLREHKIFKRPTVLVPTELGKHTEVPVNSREQTVKPDKVTEPYEVVDGTTVHLNPDVDISPSSTEGPILHTTMQEGNGPQLDEMKIDSKNTSNNNEEVIQSDIKKTLDVNKSENEESDQKVENVRSVIEGTQGLDKENINIMENTKENVELKHEETLKLHHNFKTYGLEIDKDVLEQNNHKSVNEETDENNPKEKALDETNGEVQQMFSKENSLDNVQEENSNVSKLKTENGTNINPEKTDTILLTTESPFSNEIPLPEGDNEVVTSNPKETQAMENVQSSESPDEKTEHQMFNQTNSHHLEEGISIIHSSPEVSDENENAQPSTIQKNVEEHTQNEQNSSIEEAFQPSVIHRDIKQHVQGEQSSSIGDIVQPSAIQKDIDPIKSEQNSSLEEAVQPQDVMKDPKPKPPILKDIEPVENEQNSSLEEAAQPQDFMKDSKPKPMIQEDIEPVQSEQNSSLEEAVQAEDVMKDPKPIPDDNLPSTPSQIIFGQVLQPQAFPASSEDKSNEESLQETLNESSSDEIKDEEITEGTVKANAGFFWSLVSFFTSKTEETGLESSYYGKYAQPGTSYCSVEDAVCNSKQKHGLMQDILLSLNSDIFLYLLTTAVSCIIFLFLYLAIERSRREGPLIARINKLEKELIVTRKENDLLKEQTFLSPIEMSNVPNEEFEELKNKLLQKDMLREDLEMQITALQKEVDAKHALEAQVESLEKELETSTEIGMELNKIISDMLDSSNGSEKLKENVEQLQRQLIEQKDIINTISANLSKKEKENVDLIVEVEANKKKAVDLQTRLDDMVQKILDIQKEKDDQLVTLQNEIAVYQSKYNDLSIKNEIFNNEIQKLKSQLSEAKKQLDVKTRECETIMGNINSFSPEGDKQLRDIFDTITMKAEFDQLKAENERYSMELQRIEADNSINEKKYQVIMREIEVLRQKYEQADKEKVESNMKLEVLNSYFKKRETELQEEVLKYKAIWDAKEGEATSTTERIKLLQEEIENYKSQNETLKQEILSQEIDLKSKISMLDQKLHENWVQARQTERKLEDAKQEAAQLRKKLTLRERAITENRLQSPMEQNGDLTFSPHPLESPASPPLLYRTRDHITNSPTLSGLPPFIPPPPGAPFLPPPPIPGMPMPFMPPPPSMYPGDHRPPPLGRMSSPLLNSRYSPDTSAFSPYDRNSPSPPYDSEYGASPPPVRAYSPPYNRDRDDRREFKRPPPPQQHIRSNGRNLKGSIMSSGSDRSNDSLDKINRNQSKMV